MLPVGHVPFRVDLRSAIEAGMHSIEHLTGYDRAVSLTHQVGISGWANPDPGKYDDLVQLTIGVGVWNCPTLAIYAELTRRNAHPQRDAIGRNRRVFVKRLYDAGAKLLAGSDAGIDVVPAGAGLHEELAEFVRSGLSPYEALRIATVSAAEFLGRESLGTIAAGMDAELLLVNGNPLADVRNARAIAGLVMRGAWTPASSLIALP
jgi:imidazolonepropionase-like amidohydrolase